MSGLRTLEFTGFPPELRLRIYRLLLVNYVSVARFDDLHNEADEDQSSSETDKTGLTSGSDDSLNEGDDDEESNDETGYALSTRHPLFSRLFDRRFPPFPAILRSNKLIHMEASVVFDVAPTEFWQDLFTSTLQPPNYHIRLLVDLECSGPLGSPDDFSVVESNLSEVSTGLALNDLRFVKVDVFYPHFWLERTITSTVLEKRRNAVQKCLAPLRTVRADRFSMEHSDEFLLRRRRQKEENDAESIFALGDAEADGRARGDGQGRNKGEQEKGKNLGSGNDAQGLEGAKSKSEASQEHV